MDSGFALRAPRNDVESPPLHKSEGGPGGPPSEFVPPEETDEPGDTPSSFSAA
jgi:hypothetical protein